MPEDIFGAVRGVMKRCRGAYGVVVRHTFIFIYIYMCVCVLRHMWYM